MTRLHHPNFGHIAFAAVGATLVGSVELLKEAGVSGPFEPPDILIINQSKVRKMSIGFTFSFFQVLGMMFDNLMVLVVGVGGVSVVVVVVVVAAAAAVVVVVVTVVTVVTCCYCCCCCCCARRCCCWAEATTRSTLCFNVFVTRVAW